MAEIKEIKVTVKVENLDEIKQKLEQINELLKEAKTLADELASLKLDLIFESKEGE